MKYLAYVDNELKSLKLNEENTNKYTGNDISFFARSILICARYLEKSVDEFSTKYFEQGQEYRRQYSNNMRKIKF